MIGRRLCKALAELGNDLTIFTSNPENAAKIIHHAKEFVRWDFSKINEWKKYLENQDAVIHLAGASIAGKRWDENYKKEIFNSRIISTQNLVKAISKIQNKPLVFISSSATGYYGNNGDVLLTENSNSGSDFLSNVCRAWESEAEKAEQLNVRRVSVRTGIVLTKEGGALKQMLIPFKLFVGGPLGSGRQWFPWIHIDDLVNIYLFALDNPSIKGSINAASPHHVKMNEFARTLGKILHRPSILNVPLPFLRIAIGEAAESVVSSQRVLPKILLDSGFRFKFEYVNDALRDILK